MCEVHNLADYVQQACGNMDNTAPYNATGHPALTINAGFSSTEPHLPIGMMLVGRQFDDVTVLRLAHAYETRLRNQSTDYVETVSRLSSSFFAMKS
jgi:Asp-tRNA(Asn)/Glu-tRNA(Gln) amidotransferase A subunit family amidase